MANKESDHLQIPFNKPFLCGSEEKYIADVLQNGHWSGNGKYTNKCEQIFEIKFGFQKVLLTSSGSDALEMCALLLDLQEGDEVIVPSYTFVTTASAFLRSGAELVLVDSEEEHPNVSISAIKEAISSRTRAIIVVHYGGMAVDMDAVMNLVKDTDIVVIEDAAHGMGGYYKGHALGGIGHLGIYSFHQTKNITCGEGGLLIINDERWNNRAEMILEKGTNRSSFMKGKVEKYEWTTLGSSFLPSELTAAFLWGQLECFDEIQKRRIQLWNYYRTSLLSLLSSGEIACPEWPVFTLQNGHLFYFLTKSPKERNALIKHLKENQITAAFHYIPLHLSKYYKEHYKSISLPAAERHADCLIRLPFYTDMTEEETDYVVQKVKQFYTG